MEYYRLGDIRNAVPPPPDWKHAIGQIPPWRRVQAIPDPSGLPFLNRAIFCWTVRTREPENDLGIYLLRQSFHVERPDTIARATLRVAANVEPLEAAFNEYPLHLAGVRQFSLGEFEVTPLVREGENVFAIKVRGRPGVLSSNCGLAFHLEVVRRKDALPIAPPLDLASALVTSRIGDRVRGTVQDLRSDRILLRTLTVPTPSPGRNAPDFSSPAAGKSTSRA